MPSPVYIICSEDGAIDSLTNSVSIFGVIERLRFAQLANTADISKMPPKGKPWFNIRMTAVWKRDETEAGTTFEHQTLFQLPGGAPQVISDGSFVFKHLMHRFISEMGGPSLQTEGIIRIENRIRELGQEEWTSQVYEIPVEKIVLSPKPSSDD